MKYELNCAYCDSADTEVVEHSEIFKIGRRQLTVAGMKKVVCNSCHSDFVPSDMFALNVQTYKDAEANATNVVSPSLLKDLRDLWQLSQKDASKIFGAGLSSFGKWESGQTNMSTPTALLIKVAYKIPEVLPVLAKLAKVELQQGAKNLGALVSPGVTGAYETVHIASEAVNGNVYMLKNYSHIEQKKEEPTMTVTFEWKDTAVSGVLEAA
jgi:putative zinc finger/helix-turn-helix YgiT family protein